MLSTTENFVPEENIINTNALTREGWTEMGPGLQMTHLFLGDPVSGPFVQVGHAPMLPAGPVHMHRSDTFRIGMEGSFRVGKFSYGTGDFRMQGAGHYYGPESGSGPHTLLLVMADRRGWIPTPAREGERDAMQPVIDATARFYADHIHAVLPDAGSGVMGLADTARLQYRAGRANGSFSEAENWEVSPDGVRYCLLLMGERQKGLLLLLSEAPAGVVETTPDYDTDSCRVIISGSAQWHGNTYRRGDICAITAGAGPAEIVHGHEGSKMVTLYADRSACMGDFMDAGVHWITSRLQDLLS